MKRDAGVILVNVLVVLALGAAIVVLMFTSQENLMDRTRRAAAMTQSEALVAGAEASLVTALRRDMQTAPQTDHFQEPWALATQEEVVLTSGRFSVEVTDARSRFDLNSLAAGRLSQQQMFVRLAKAIGLSDRAVTGTIDQLVRYGPVQNMYEITALDEQERRMLSAHVSLLPQPGPINVNTAGEVVLAAVLGSDSSARQLIKTRARKGFLTQGDLTDAGVITMNGAGFTSDVFDVQSTAEVDGVSLTLTSRLLRKTELGQRSVLVISRQYGASTDSAEPMAPPRLRP